MLIILSVFLVLIICSGAASASSETNQTLTTEYNDEIVNEDNTDEKLTVEVSSAGSNDDSGLKELGSENKDSINTTIEIKQQKNSEPLLKASNENLKLGASINVDGSTFGDIQTAINGAGAGDIIYLNSPRYVGSGTGISINKEVTIIGCEGCILDAQKQSKIFNIAANNVKLSNLTLKNGLAPVNILSGGGGGAINARNSNNLILSNCNFTECAIKDLTTISNYKWRYGGAINLDGCNATISKCNFNDNSVFDGYIYYYAYRYGGAISLSKTDCNIIDSNFTNNQAEYGGAVFFDENSKGTISNCNFNRNRAYGWDAYGGAIYWAGSNGNVKNCNFTSQSLSNYRYGETPKGLNTIGGAIYWAGSNGTVDNCNFNGNKIEETYDGYINVRGEIISGGAIYWAGSNGTVSNSNFINNYFKLNSYLDSSGGAITIAGSATVDNCNLINNYLSNTMSLYIAANGGAISITGNGTITNSNFTKNQIISTSTTHPLQGGAIYSSGNVNVSGSKFTGNNATNGGAVYSSGNGTITNSNFTGNTATNAGAIYSSGNVNVSGSKFTGNNATNGGAVYSSGNGTITNSNFTGNTATNGGAVYSSGNGTITNSNFTGNTATNGGAVRLTGNGNITYSNFTGNNATTGGAVHLDGSGNITYSNFIGNRASSGGGAIYTVNGNVINSNFTNNRAGTGGAIYGIRGVVKDSVFIDNKAGSRLTFTFVNGLPTGVIFYGNENYINAVYSSTVIFDNVTYWNGTNIVNSDDIAPVKSTQESGFNITIELYNSKNELVDNITTITDSNGKVDYNYNKYEPNENYRIKAYHLEDNYYTYSTTGTSFRTPNLYNVIVLNTDTCYILENISTKLNATIKNSQNNKTINPSSFTYNIISDFGYSSSKVVFVGKNDIPITVKYSWGDDYGDDLYNVAFENAKLYVTVDYMNEYEFDASEKEGYESFTIPNDSNNEHYIDFRLECMDEGLEYYFSDSFEVGKLLFIHLHKL